MEFEDPPFSLLAHVHSRFVVPRFRMTNFPVRTSLTTMFREQSEPRDPECCALLQTFAEKHV